jgi:hypothetical protein
MAAVQYVQACAWDGQGNVTRTQLVTIALSDLPISGDPSTFLRGDGAYMAPTTKVKQTTIDFGSMPVSDGTFTVQDAGVTMSSNVMAQVAYVAPPGKDLDELEMDNLVIRCAPGNGYFTMFVNEAIGSLLADKFLINYQIG